MIRWCSVWIFQPRKGAYTVSICLYLQQNILCQTIETIVLAIFNEQTRSLVSVQVLLTAQWKKSGQLPFLLVIFRIVLGRKLDRLRWNQFDRAEDKAMLGYTALGTLLNDN